MQRNTELSEDTLVFATKVFFGFFAIMNPFSTTPIYLAMARGFDDRDAKRIARRSVIVAFVIVSVFVVGGKLIFEAFGLTFSAFQLAGGIIVFLVGLDLLKGVSAGITSSSADAESHSRASAERIAISPLAIPILAGPGTIATAMHFVVDQPAFKFAITVAIFFAMCIATYLMFRFGEKLINTLGNSVVDVIGRIMGLILAIIGTEMAIQGIKRAFGLE